MQNINTKKISQESQNLKKSKIVNLLLISVIFLFYPLFFLKEIKANGHVYRTYADKSKKLSKYFCQTDWECSSIYNTFYISKDAKRIFLRKNLSAIWHCPGGKTRIAGVFNPETPNRGLFENLEGYFFQNIPNLKKGWDISVNYEYYNGNRLRNNSWRHYPNMKLKSISSSLFFIPPEKEVYLGNNYENFKANIEKVIDTKDYFKLKSIYFIKSPKCKGSSVNCPKENAMHEFINGNRKVYLMDSMGYRGNFLLMNSKNEVFEGLYLNNDDFQTIVCKGNTLIHGTVNSFTLDTEDDVGNIKRGPLLFLVRESKYELQNENFNYPKPSL